jgi:hypothetical protein
MAVTRGDPNQWRLCAGGNNNNNDGNWRKKQWQSNDVKMLKSQ